MSSTVINVAAVGFDEIGLARIDMIFRTQFKGLCQFSSLQEAHVALIDLGAKGKNSVVDEFFAKHSSLPHVFLGEGPNDEPDSVCIPKPPKIKLLYDTLQQLSSSNQGAGAKVSSLSKTDIKQTQSQSLAPAKNAEMYFNIDDYLLGSVLHAIDTARKTESAVHIKCWNDRHIIIYPNSNSILSDLKTAQLKNLGLVQVINSTKIEIKALDDKALNSLSKSNINEVWAVPLENFIWNLALRTSRGRLPSDTDPNQCYRLLRWPNFTRIDTFPHNMRIAAYWIQNPCTLTEIIHKLGIEEKYVYLFYAAASAMDIVELATTRNAKTNVEKTKHQKRSLFSELLNHLSLRGKNKEKLKA